MLRTETLATIADTIGNIVLLAFIVVLAFQSIVQLLLVSGVPLSNNLLARLTRADRYRVRALVQDILYKEHELIRSHGKASVDLVLGQLGLRYDAFEDIRHDILQRIQEPHSTSIERQKNLRGLVVSSAILIDTKSMPDPLYKDVDYYLNFADIMMDATFGPHFGQLLADHVRENVRFDDLARLVLAVPTKGNAMLGFYTARHLNRPLILMRPEPRLNHGQYWDGKIAQHTPVALLHDVAVTGEQLLESQRLLKNAHARVLGVFALVERTDKLRLTRLDEAGLKVSAVLSLDEKILSDLREEELYGAR
jgi:orotate phosphoribosyltransferase